MKGEDYYDFSHEETYEDDDDYADPIAEQLDTYEDMQDA